MIHSSGNLRFISGENTPWAIEEVSIGTIETGSWYHVAVTYDRNYLSFYINGNLDSSFEETEPLYSNVHSVLIGKTNNNYYYFNGKIDEVRIYNRALTADENKAHYEG